MQLSVPARLIVLLATLSTLPASARADDRQVATRATIGLHHNAIERAAPKQSLAFTATVDNCSECRLVVYTRTRGRSFFGRLPMTGAAGEHRAVLAASETVGDYLHYYIEARNSAGELVARSGRADSPHVVMLDPSLTPPPAPPTPPAPVVHTSARANVPHARSQSRCDVGPAVSYIRYEEPGVMEEAGLMMGVSAGCQYGERTYAAFESRFSFGWIDYNGQLMTGESYQVSNNFNTLFEVRGLVGKRLFNGVRAHLDGYMGVGYRRLFDGLGQDSAGYDRTSQYVYSPVGLRFATRARKTNVEARAEYRHFWTGRQRSELSDLSPMLADITNRQHRGHGWSLGVGLSTTGLWGVHAELQPYINHWSIEASDAALVGTDTAGRSVYLHEPKNNSTEVGFNLAVQF